MQLDLSAFLSSSWTNLPSYSRSSRSVPGHAYAILHYALNPSTDRCAAWNVLCQRAPELWKRNERSLLRRRCWFQPRRLELGLRVFLITSIRHKLSPFTQTICKGIKKCIAAVADKSKSKQKPFPTCCCWLTLVLHVHDLTSRLRAVPRPDGKMQRGSNRLSTATPWIISVANFRNVKCYILILDRRDC